MQTRPQRELCMHLHRLILSCMYEIYYGKHCFASVVFFSAATMLVCRWWNDGGPLPKVEITFYLTENTNGKSFNALNCPKPLEPAHSGPNLNCTLYTLLTKSAMPWLARFWSPKLYSHLADNVLDLRSKTNSHNHVCKPFQGHGKELQGTLRDICMSLYVVEEHICVLLLKQKHSLCIGWVNMMNKRNTENNL